jgi:hypothetical protein
MFPRKRREYVLSLNRWVSADGEQIMALGNGTATPGVNQKLLPWLQARKGKRFGIISAFSHLSVFSFGD